MQTIALVDVNHGRGHHLTYMRLICKTLIEIGYRVLAFYPAPNEITDWIKLHCPDQISNFYAFEINEFESRKVPVIEKIPSRLQPLIILTRWQYTASVIKNAANQVGFSPDLVFFNWLDNYLSYYLTHHIIDRIFPYKWAGLYFRPGDLRFKKKLPVFHHGLARSPHCQALAILNEEQIESIQAKIKAPVYPFPDLTDASSPDLAFEVVEQIREKAGNRKIIGLAGSLSKRKGLLTLLEAARRSIDENWFFVFAGALPKSTFSQDYDQKLISDYETVQSIIQSQPENCFFYLQHIPTESQYNALINCFDILFAAYENFPYSSNTLTKAAVFRKPVIVSEGFCMANRVKQFQLGVTIPEGDVSKCIEAIHSLCQTSDANIHPPQFNFEGYQKLHSTGQLKKLFGAILGDREVQLDFTKKTEQIANIS